MSKDSDNFLSTKKEIFSQDVGQSRENTCAALTARIKLKEEAILLEKQHIADNKKYIAERELDFLIAHNLQLENLAKSSSSNTELQQIAERVQFNLNLITEISEAPGGILPKVQEAKEATRNLERNLENLQQELHLLEQELAAKETNMPWGFFAGNSTTEKPDDSDEEPDQALGAFQTLNQRLLKG